MCRPRAESPSSSRFFKEDRRLLCSQGAFSAAQLLFYFPHCFGLSAGVLSSRNAHGPSNKKVALFALSRLEKKVKTTVAHIGQC